MWAQEEEFRGWQNLQQAIGRARCRLHSFSCRRRELERSRISQVIPVRQRPDTVCRTAHVKVGYRTLYTLEGRRPIGLAAGIKRVHCFARQNGHGWCSVWCIDGCALSPPDEGKEAAMRGSGVEARTRDQV